jgi:hypothetical protein
VLQKKERKSEEWKCKKRMEGKKRRMEKKKEKIMEEVGKGKP